MTVDSSLAAIDELLATCGWCDVLLTADASSTDWCSPEHQAAWHAARSERLPWSEDAAMVYVEADHLRVPLNDPMHRPVSLTRFSDFVEAFALATEPRNHCPNPSAVQSSAGWMRGGSIAWVAIDEVYQSGAVTSDAVVGRVTGLRSHEWARRLNEPDTITVTYDEPYRTPDMPDPPTPAERAIQARRNRSTGPPAARMDGRRGRGVRR